MELNKDKAAVAQERNFKGYAVVFYDDCTTVLVYSSAINARRSAILQGDRDRVEATFGENRPRYPFLEPDGACAAYFSYAFVNPTFWPRSIMEQSRSIANGIP